MKLAEIQQLMQQFESSDLRELEINDGAFHLYLSKNQANRTGKVTSRGNADPSKAASAPVSSAKVAKKGTAIKSPLVGTVYLQSKPDADPYVTIGSHVKRGDVVCVIEAMKMMTEITSNVTGTITAVQVSNEELVEVEQPLFTVEEDT